MNRWRLALLLLTLPAAAHAGNWQVDPAQSSIRFEGTDSGAPFTGQFNGFTADITFDPADLAHARADIAIDVANPDTGNAERDSEINGPDWFDIARFPTARFTTTAIHRLGHGNKYEAEGQLTLRDITQPVTLPFTLEIDGATATMTAETTLTRTDFGIGQGNWASSDEVGPTVRVLIHLLAQKTPPA